MTQKTTKNTIQQNNKKTVEIFAYLCKRLYICHVSNENIHINTSKPTISDIAKALNVTPSTVSRALAGNTRVSLATREAVKQKAEELGYERNALASSLRKGTTDTVGMIVPRINRQFFSTVISGVEAILNPAGYNLIISQSHERTGDEHNALMTMLRNQVSGLIISHALAAPDSDLLKTLPKHNFALVQFDRVYSNLNGVTVTNDNFSGAYQATTHLIKSGYKRIGHLSGDELSNVYLDRAEGYKKALQDNGISIDESIIFTDCITRDKGFYGMEKAVQAGCDALYCAGDYAALGAVEYAKNCNISIPNEFGIVGTGNENFSELMTPSLTTLEQNAFDIGNRVAQAFLDIKNGETVLENNVIVPMRLVVRESSRRDKK